MRFTYRAAGPITAAVILTLLSGCSRTQQDWGVAQRAGTPQAYELFVRRHPGSELAGVARQRIAQLTEEAAWQQATRANTAAAYQQYLARYPDGSWSQDARIRMESRSLAQAQGAPAIAPGAEAPAAAASAPEAGASSPGARTAPAARPDIADDAAPVRAAGSEARSSHVTSIDSGAGPGSAVQLGAFSSTANARAQWRRLSGRFRPQLRGLTPRIIPVRLSGRRLYRLEARVASRSAARRLCRQLQQRSQGCLPLP